MKSASNKQRLLTLMNIFKLYSDENHKLSIDDIYEKMVQAIHEDFNVDRKAIASDIASLDENGFTIDIETGSHGKKLYYHQEKELEVSELRMLMDAVQSAKFITSSETERLIGKLKAQTSVFHAETLENQIFIAKDMKCENKSIQSWIDNIHAAISKGLKIKFKYGKYNEFKEFKHNREGKDYTLMPYALAWSNEFYYLIGIYEGKDNISNYRIDRITDLRVTEETFERQDFDLSAYLNRTFNMFSGVSEVVHLRFINEYINVVIDKFGRDVEIISRDEKTFDVKLEASDTEGFRHWLLSCGKNVKVISPESIRKKLLEETDELLKSYEE